MSCWNLSLLNFLCAIIAVHSVENICILELRTKMQACIETNEAHARFFLKKRYSFSLNKMKSSVLSRQLDSHTATRYIIVREFIFSSVSIQSLTWYETSNGYDLFIMCVDPCKMFGSTFILWGHKEKWILSYFFLKKKNQFSIARFVRCGLFVFDLCKVIENIFVHIKYYEEKKNSQFTDCNRMCACAFNRYHYKCSGNSSETNSDTKKMLLT